MSSGFDPVAPGTHFSQWDVASRRRYNASQGAPRPSWDVPEGWSGHPADQVARPASSQGTLPATVQNPATAPSYNFATGDVPLAYRNSAMADAASRASGARLTAENAAPNDPSLMAYANLEGELGGQSQASHDVNSYLAELAHEKQQQDFQMAFEAYRQKLMEEEQQAAHQNDWLTALGSIGGKVAGSWLSPGGIWG